MHKQDETPPCKTHPDAPHGFDRDGSHTAGRYVCDCEHWVEPEQSSPSPLPQRLIAPDQTGQDRRQGEGEQYDKTLQECAELRAQANNWTDEERERLGKEVKEMFADIAPQSAVEWAKATWDTMWKSVNFSWTEVMSKLIEPLARRCVEAEEMAEQGVQYHLEAQDLRAQLAAAQARADLETDNARQSREEIEALKGDIARLQHENTAHRVAWENAEQRERELAQALASVLDDWSLGYKPSETPDVYAAARAALAKHKEAQP